MLVSVTQVHHGLLWVWPDADAELAAATPAAVMQELDKPGWSSLTQGWYVRDLPASMEGVIENVSGWCIARVGPKRSRLGNGRQHWLVIMVQSMAQAESRRVRRSRCLLMAPQSNASSGANLHACIHATCTRKNTCLII